MTLHSEGVSIRPIAEPAPLASQRGEKTRRYEEFFRLSEDGIVFHELMNGRFLEANPAVCRLLGYSEAELLTMTPRDLIAPEDPAVCNIEGLERGGVCRYEKVLTARDGRRIPVEMISRLYEQDGKAMVMSCIRDISDRKRAEAAVEEERREMALINRILRVFAEERGDALFEKVLGIVLEGLGSEHGVFGYISEPGHLVCPSLSAMLADCEVANKCIHYPPEKWKGLWARALKEKRSLYSNRPGCVPAGHIAIENNLATPILFHGEVIGLLNAANKAGGYTDEDVRLLEAMAERLSPLLYAWIQRTLRKEALETSARRYQELAEALQKSEQEKTLILDNANEMIAYHDADHNLIWANRAYQKFTGLSLEEMKGRKCYEAWGLTQLCVNCPVSISLRENKPVVAEMTPQNQPDWLAGQGEWLVRTAPVCDGSGRVIGAIEVAHDISARREIETVLKQSELFYRQTLESIPGMVFTTRPDGYCDYQSRQWAEYTGVPMSEHLGDGWVKLLHPEDRPRALATWRDAVAGKAPYNLEYRVRRHDGVYEWFKVIGRPIQDGAGATVRWFGVATNIHEIKETEAAMRKSEGRFRLLSETAGQLLESREPQAVVEELCRSVLEYLDCDCFFNYLADGASGRLRLNAYAGIPQAEARRIAWLDYGVAVCGCVAEGGRRIVAENIQHGGDCRTELVKSYGVQAYACHPLTAQGRVIGTLSFGSRKRTSFHEDDLALMKTVADQVATAMQRIMSEQALRQLNETLEERVARRTTEVEEKTDQLRALAMQLSRAEQKERKRLAKILHDHIQQLIVAARMQLGWIKPGVDAAMAAETTAEVRDILKEALDASRSLAVDLSPPVLQEAGLVGGLHWLASDMAKKSQFTVHVQAESRAEPASEETRALLFECVREMLLNSMKHARVSEAKVALLRAGDQVRLIVSDEGVGFDPDLLAKRRSDEVSFGLFSCQERLVQIGGQMEIETAPGAGARITMTAPMGETKPAERAEKTPRHKPARPVQIRRKKGVCRMLIVDDHKIVREGFGRLFQFESDIEVIGEAADGPTALKLAYQLRPDVIIMDVNLGRYSGVETTRRILERFPTIRVIGLSMHADEAVAQSMREAGARAYLTKSGPSEELIAAVRQAMEE